jgi:hypothetical protein
MENNIYIYSFLMPSLQHYSSLRTPADLWTIMRIPGKVLMAVIDVLLTGSFIYAIVIILSSITVTLNNVDYRMFCTINKTAHGIFPSYNYDKISPFKDDPCSVSAPPGILRSDGHSHLKLPVVAEKPLDLDWSEYLEEDEVDVLADLQSLIPYSFYKKNVLKSPPTSLLMKPDDDKNTKEVERWLTMWFLESSFVLEGKKSGDNCSATPELSKGRFHLDVLMKKHFGKRKLSLDSRWMDDGAEDDERLYEGVRAELNGDKQRKFYEKKLMGIEMEKSDF